MSKSVTVLELDFTLAEILNYGSDILAHHYISHQPR